MEAMGTLAGGMAHDFNNLLTGIQGYITLLTWETDDAHPHYSKLKAIEKLVQSGASLTRQMLGYAGGNRGETRLTDMNELMGSTGGMFGRTKKEIRIEERFEQNLWSVEVDPGQFEQVFLNLFVNAWQAMPDGGTLYLETRNVTIGNPISAVRGLPGTLCKLSVTDTEWGWMKKPHEDFRSLLYHQAKEQGTGLGLASVYGIVKGTGGSSMFTVKRGPGPLSIFIFRHPAKKP